MTHTFDKDVMAGDYFVFINRAKNRCKVLCWDRDGFALFAERLERGCFQLPGSDTNSIVTEVDTTTLAMILGGVDLQSAKRRKRYQVSPVVTLNDVATPARRASSETQTAQ